MNTTPKFDEYALPDLVTPTGLVGGPFPELNTQSLQRLRFVGRVLKPDQTPYIPSSNIVHLDHPMEPLSITYHITAFPRVPFGNCYIDEFKVTRTSSTYYVTHTRNIGQPNGPVLTTIRRDYNSTVGHVAQYVFQPEIQMRIPVWCRVNHEHYSGPSYDIIYGTWQEHYQHELDYQPTEWDLTEEAIEEEKLRRYIMGSKEAKSLNQK